MLAFIVPVKSKKVTSDWAFFSSLVDRCIQSTCNQTNPAFKVIVACHEIPETKFNNDARVEFLQVKFPPPILKQDDNDNKLKEADKGKKIIAATEHALKLEASFVMTVDSDDCVSNKLADFIQRFGNTNSVGWYVKKGYVYREGSKFTFLNLKNFSNVCGSSVIIKPGLMEMMFDHEPSLLFFHQRLKLSNGQLLEPLPFPGALYSVGNGENHYMSLSQAVEKNNHGKFYELRVLKLLINKIKKYRPKIIGGRLKKEFSLYPIIKV